MDQKTMQLVSDSDFSDLINSLIQEKLSQYQTRIDNLQQAYLKKSNKLYKLEKELSELKIKSSQEDISEDFIKSILPTYRAPIKEQASYKNIPIKYLNAFKKHFKGQYRMRYRGNNAKDQGHINPRSYVRAEHATTFSMYKINKKGA